MSGETEYKIIQIYNLPSSSSRSKAFIQTWMQKMLRTMKDLIKEGEATNGSPSP